MKIKLLTAVALATLVIHDPIHAGTHIWSGVQDGNWGNPANWSSGGPPSPFEAPPVIVQLPSTLSARRQTTNNIYNLKLDVLQFFGSDYTLHSLGPITLTGTQPPFPYLYNLGAGGSGTNIIDYSAPLIFLTNVLIGVANNGAELHVKSQLSGAGGFTKMGHGSLFLDGDADNTYQGAVSVQDGILALDDAYLYYGWFALEITPFVSVPGNLTIGSTDFSYAPSVQILKDNQFRASNTNTLAINANGTLNLLGWDTHVPALEMTGGAINLQSAVFYDDYYTFQYYTNIPTLYCVTNLTSHPSRVSTATISGPGTLYFKDTTTNAGVATINVIGGDLLFNSGVGSDYTLVKTGPGHLAVTNCGTWGDFILSQGSMAVSGNLESAHTPPHSLIISNGAQLSLGAQANCYMPAHLNGFGTNGDGAALLVAGNGASLPLGISVDSDSAISVLNTNDTAAIDTSDFYSILTGSGSLTKKGPGTLMLAGGRTNQISGSILVDQGTLTLNYPYGVPAVNSPLLIGHSPANGTAAEVKFLNSYQLPSTIPITIYDSGTLNLNDFIQSVEAITLRGGDIKTYSGWLNLVGDLYATNCTGSLISGTVNLGAGKRTFHLAPGCSVNIQAQITDIGTELGFDLDGGGSLTLSGANTALLGPINVKAGLLYARSDLALGDSAGGTTIASGARLAIDGRNLGAEPLTLNGDGGGYGALSCSKTNTFTGPVTLGSDTVLNVVSPADRLIFGGIVSGSAAITKIGEGTLAFTGNQANAYTGTTTVSEGTLELNKNGFLAVPGALVIGDDLSQLGSHIVRIFSAGQLAPAAPLTINASGVLDLTSAFFAPQTIASLTGSGQVQLGVSSLTVANNSDEQFDGTFTGTGTLFKQGAGKLTLGGASVQFFGYTTVNGGTLNVQNWIPSSPVSVNAGAKLMGSGMVGNVSAAGGIVSPGCCIASKKLTAKNLSLDPASQFVVELNGTNAGVYYSQLATTGTVSLANATLSATLGFNGGVGNKFTIIDNDAADAVSGTFKNLPEGATFIIGGAQFQITYHGGDGNDVVLTQISAASAPQISGITKLPNGAIQTTATGTAGASYVVEANTNLATSTWVNLGTSLANTNGAISFTDVDATNFPMRFYRLRLP